MTSHDHHEIAKMLFVESQKHRSNLKAIFDLAKDRIILEQAIAVAHNSLSKHEHKDAIVKLLHYRNHYFTPIEYHYPNDDKHDIKEITEHSISVINKWVNEIEQAMTNQKPYKGFNRFIHRSVAALAKKLAHIEPLELRQQYFTIAAYKITHAFIEYSQAAQSVISSSIAKICAQMGVTDALLRLNEQDGEYFYQSSGVSLPLEIQNMQRVIDHAHQNYDYTGSQCYKPKNVKISYLPVS